jgi:hypothetical protein
VPQKHNKNGVISSLSCAIAQKGEGDSDAPEEDDPQLLDAKLRHMIKDMEDMNECQVRRGEGKPG